MAPQEKKGDRIVGEESGLAQLLEEIGKLRQEITEQRARLAQISILEEECRACRQELQELRQQASNYSERSGDSPVLASLANSGRVSKSPSTSRRKLLAKLAGGLLMAGGLTTTFTTPEPAQAKVSINPRPAIGALALPQGSSFSGAPPANSHYGLVGSPDTSLNMNSLPAVNSGIVGYSAGGSPETIGIYGKSGGYGVVGSSPGGYGVSGSSDSGTGVIGQSLSGDGVLGYSNDKGIGVFGQSLKGTGVKADSTSGTGLEATSVSGIGIHGTSIGETGVRGESTHLYGVWGISTDEVGV